MAPTRVLVIAAQPHVRRILRFLLELEGYEVQAAADGEQGWRAVTSFRPDLVLTEATLPRRDGLALLGTMRGRCDLAGIPVIVLCAPDTPEARVAALRQGANDVMPLVFNQNELLLRVRNLLRSTSNTRRVNRLAESWPARDGRPSRRGGRAAPA
jgi:two-component system response regulator MprA